jgi:hypothetical protein
MLDRRDVANWQTDHGFETNDVMIGLVPHRLHISVRGNAIISPSRESRHLYARTSARPFYVTACYSTETSVSLRRTLLANVARWPIRAIMSHRMNEA